jgi:preprotein translocase subunit SecD
MNRYPLWKYILIVVTLVAATLYTLPNLFGESPAVQISSGRATVKMDDSVRDRAVLALKDAGVNIEDILVDANSVKLRFNDTEVQLKAKDVIQGVLGDGYIVALNLLPRTPSWLTSIGGKPMALGLDLRGGVHFLLEVDMKAAVDKALEKSAGDVRRGLREKKIRYGKVTRERDRIEVVLRDAETVDAAVAELMRRQADMVVTATKGDGNNRVTLAFKPEALTQLKLDAVQQNLTTLHNRVNALGVAEPVIQQQGEGRIVVQLPGVQDTAKAKDILGRTASLEVRLVEDDRSKLEAALAGSVAAGTELLYERDAKGGQPILLKKEVELSGDNINKARTGFDQNNQPAVDLWLDGPGESIMRSLSRENIGKRLALVLVEQGKGEVITAPVIRSELGNQFQISGSMSQQEANDVALLISAGALAAPMAIVEERAIGPSLGAENITKGFHSTLYGFLGVVLFMIVYYRMFGVISALALSANILFLLACLSLLQVTLTLPGIAAIALTLGMAIDSNVLINERIREELRDGMKPGDAIRAGYDHAWHTILDSNVTSLIAGIALLAFGSGAVRGFAWVHCFGIMTSMYSAVFVSRGITNLIYGYRRRLTSIAV